MLAWCSGWRTRASDEDAIKTALKGARPDELAVELASAKALAVSRRDPDAWVLGADQTLAFDGGLVSKAGSLDEARTRLISMRGKTHELHSGAALAYKGTVVWSGVGTARMRMRDYSDAFLDAYLKAEGEGFWPVSAPIGWRAWGRSCSRLWTATISPCWACPCGRCWRSCVGPE